MTKDQRTIKQLTQQLADLTSEITRLKLNLVSECLYKNKYRDELDDIHTTFDLLDIPRRVKNTYHDLTANARLTLFLAQTNGIKVEQPKEGE